MATHRCCSVTEPLLSIQNLRVEYLTERGSIVAVSDVSLDIGAGEVVGLAGESGSGKSTIALALLRALQPPGVITGGKVLFRGRDVLAMSTSELRAFRWSQVAMVFQSAMNVLNPVLSIGQQLTDTLLAHQSHTQVSAERRARELLERVQLDHVLLSSFPHQLSGGMRQRVVIAMAMALDPKLLIMDEPTTALDVIVERQIIDNILELQSEQGFSVLFISHDLSLMFQFVQTLAVCYAGKLCEIGSSRRMLRSPQHPYTRGLLDSFPSLRGPKRGLKGIGGAPPNLGALPPGCNFAPRCSSAEARCAETEPKLLPLGKRERVACHFPLFAEEAQRATAESGPHPQRDAHRAATNDSLGPSAHLTPDGSRAVHSDGGDS